MSLNPLSNATTGWTVDPHPDNRYASNALAEAGRSNVDVFDSLSREEQAVNKVAGDVCDSLHPIKEDGTALGICNYNERPSSEGRVSNHPATNIPPSPESMDTLTLNPKMKKVLDDWVKKGKHPDRRDIAQDRIMHFLENPGKTELDLSGLGLKFLPDIFGEKPFVSRLKYLDLSYNQLTSLPKKICELKRLRVLGLANNKLTSLPKGIRKLQRLRVLDLANNKLTSLPKGILKLQRLRVLDLVNNKLTLLPKGTCQLRKLRDLDLSSNKFSLFPKKICWLSNLEILFLSNNQLTSLPEKISQLSNLVSLALFNNKLTSLPNEICQLNNLERLDLTNNSKLQSLPNNLTILVTHCDVYPEGTGLPEGVRDTLRQARNASG